MLTKLQKNLLTQKLEEEEKAKKELLSPTKKKVDLNMQPEVIAKSEPKKKLFTKV